MRACVRASVSSSMHACMCACMRVHACVQVVGSGTHACVLAGAYGRVHACMRMRWCVNTQTHAITLIIIIIHALKNAMQYIPSYSACQSTLWLVLRLAMVNVASFDVLHILDVTYQSIFSHTCVICPPIMSVEVD